jgi:CrcB protein
MDVWSRILLLSLGGAVGVNARYWLGLGITRWTHESFPWATLAINVIGSFLIGLLATIFVNLSAHPHHRLFFATGVLGGFTTFSSFSLEAFELWRRGHAVHALTYLGGSVAAGFLAVALGVMVAEVLIPGRASEIARVSLIGNVEPELIEEADGGVSS